MNAADQPDDRLDLRRIEPRHHLVEQEQGRLGGERPPQLEAFALGQRQGDRKSTRLNSSHSQISYAVFCLKKKKKTNKPHTTASAKSTARLKAAMRICSHPTHH